MSQEIKNRAVKIGIALGFIVSLLLFFTFYNLMPKMAQEVMLIERVKLAIECLVFPVAFFLIIILRVGSQRYGNPSEDPTKTLANSEGMKIDLRVLSNTHE